MSSERRAMVFIPGQGYTSGAVDVYRDGPNGEEVVVIGKADHVRQTPRGTVAVSGDIVVRFESIATYEWARARAFERDPVKYARLIGALGVNDDARTAPMLPPGALPAARDHEESPRLAHTNTSEAAERGGFFLLPASEGV